MKKVQMRSSIEGIFFATTRAELHKIHHNCIQVVAEGIRLENYIVY